MTLSAATADTPVVVFLLDDQRHALDLAQVERVVQRVAIAPFPHAPAVIAGAFSLHGETIPVVNLRHRFGRPERAPRLSDALVVVTTPRRRLAFVADSVEPVQNVAASDLADAPTLVPGLEHLRGLARIAGGELLFIVDLDALLSLEEEAALARAAAAPAP